MRLWLPIVAAALAGQAGSGLAQNYPNRPGAKPEV